MDPARATAALVSAPALVLLASTLAACGAPMGNVGRVIGELGNALALLVLVSIVVPIVLLVAVLVAAVVARRKRKGGATGD